jgi:hypothetical protein
MPILSPIAISPHRIGGKSWSSYWTNQFKPVIEKQYYWWDNISGAERSIHIFHKWQGMDYGADYKILKGNDDWYEIGELTYRQMIGMYNGDKSLNNMTNNLTYSVGDSATVDTMTFNGTDLVLSAYKGSGKGIGRFILFDGTLRGYLVVGINGPNAVNADKAAGRYYIVQQAGNYSNIDASMSALEVYDLIYYTGSAWQIYHQAQYTYIDVDFYAESTATLDTYTLFSGLTAGTYKLGILPKNTKNVSSSAYTITLRDGDVVKERSFKVTGGTSINYTELIAHLIPESLPHFTMATTISKAGTADTPGWIPQHAAAAYLEYDTGYDMQNWIDDVEVTGNLVSDAVLEECDEYHMENVAFAINAANIEEHLMTVTSSITITTSGVNLKYRYDVLVNTLISTLYCVQVPWYYTVFNRFVSDYKQELTLPDNLDTVNITDGANRSHVFVYNNTEGGDYENIILRFDVPDPAANGRGSSEQSFLYNMGSNRGKAYVKAASYEVFTAGTVYENEINVICGYVADLIDNVAAYV